jgi:hypothetical protein
MSSTLPSFGINPRSSVRKVRAISCTRTWVDRGVGWRERCVLGRTASGVARVPRAADERVVDGMAASWSWSWRVGN